MVGAIRATLSTFRAAPSGIGKLALIRELT
jgi:hypothetical protein